MRWVTQRDATRNKSPFQKARDPSAAYYHPEAGVSIYSSLSVVVEKKKKKSTKTFKRGRRAAAPPPGGGPWTRAPPWQVIEPLLHAWSR